VTERQRSIPFLQSDDIFLWFCLTCRESGIPASKRLKVLDEVAALDIDNAVALRLVRFDTEVNKNMARLIAYEVSKIFGTSEESHSDTSGAVIW
jgi:hypothetical protein